MPEDPTLGELFRIVTRLELLINQALNDKVDRRDYETTLQHANETHKELETMIAEVRGWIISAVRLVIFIVLTAIIGLVIIPLPGK